MNMWLTNSPRHVVIFCAFFILRVLGIYHVDGYIIDDSCNLVGGLKSKAVILEGAILSMRYGIQSKVLVDAQQGTASRHGYTALFKTDDSKEQVISVYRKILAGGAFYHKCQVAPYMNVTFSCPNVHQYDPSNACAKSPSIRAALRSDRAWNLRICPSWFERPKKATAKFCPSLKNNIMTETHLADTQVGILTHELSHVYGAVPSPTKPCTDLMDQDNVVVANETYGMQQCAELPADQQLHNAQNLALYASGRLIWFSRTFAPLIEFASC